jgi:Predicted metal-dependent hydrolase with the TIM-barrel fold
VLLPAAVLIENGKIKEVGAPAKVQASSGTKVIDLGNATLLPGLIDSHTHCLWTLLRRRKPSGRVITTAAFCRGYCWRLSNRPASES